VLNIEASNIDSLINARKRLESIRSVCLKYQQIMAITFPLFNKTFGSQYPLSPSRFRYNWKSDNLDKRLWRLSS